MSQEEQNMTNWSEETTHQVLKEVARRSTNDTEFRKLCLSNPGEAISSVSDTPLPPNFKIRFVENQGANMTVVLPDPVTGNELQDADLEAVVGGFKFALLPSDWSKLSWMEVPDPILVIKPHI